MLKIPKGLKKKKKGKKGKHKGDEDLFTPEELEAYRREKALKEQQQLEAEQAHQEEEREGEAQGSPPEQAGDEHLSHAPEDEDRFQALLGGVDSILNRTQRDLDRIKSTSYFQRKPTPSELGEKKSAARPDRPAPPTSSAVAASNSKSKKRWVGFGEGQDDFESEEESERPVAEAPKESAAPPPEEQHQVQSEESEEEEDEDADDIFDTSYIDVITSGEVKLAYIPESPTDEQADGDDPFDTTYAAKVIGNDEDIKKRQKLEKVSLGIAVDVLTGKAAPPSKPQPLPENAVAKRAVPRRVKPVNLLKLGSLEDDGENLGGASAVGAVEDTEVAPKSLLDDDALLAIPEDLPPVGTPIIPPVAVVSHTADTSDLSKTEDGTEEKKLQIDISEFDVITEKPVVALPISNLVLVAAALGTSPAPPPGEPEDDLEDEFAALAAESIQKKKEEEDDFGLEGDDPFDTSVAAEILGQPATPEPPKPAADVDVLLSGPPSNWSAFDDDDDHHNKLDLKPSRPPPPRPLPPKSATSVPNLDEDESNVDPFDTSFAHNILPGKTELKFIEREILGKNSSEVNEARILSNSDSDFDFNPREGEEARGIQSGVSIHVTDPAGRKESPEGDPFDTEDSGLTVLRPIHRDLLGGSTTDLSKLAHDPIEPELERKGNTSPPITEIKDPFDTSAVEAVAVPGKTELKYLEKEILGDIKPAPLKRGLSDEDFDPRGGEGYDTSGIKITRPDVLLVQSTGEGPSHKSVAFALPSPALKSDLLGAGNEEGIKFSKPLTPYYAEGPLPLDPVLNGNVEKDPFDTGHVTNLAPGKTELKILEKELVGDGSSKQESNLCDEDFDPRAVSPASTRRTIEDCDIFAVEDNIGHKPLTPSIEGTDEVDPFDTSIASNIAPGKAELKVLEKELISEDIQSNLKRTYTDPDFNPRDGPIETPDLLNQPESETAGAKPLTPVLGEQTSVENGDENADPFDTSFAAEIGPGKAELRVLESELIGKQ